MPITREFKEKSLVLDADWHDMHDSFSERDTNVLHVIEEEDLASFTFEGLKRRLRVHPETLSRVLGRLEDQGIVEKVADGYRVTSKAKEFLKFHSFSARAPSVHILRTLLPPNIPIQQVVSSLKGKWFGVLRWLGYSESDEGVTLKWITENGGTIIAANFAYGKLNISAKLLWEKDLNVAFRASYQLMGHISKLYSGLGRDRVAYFAHFDPYSLSA